jgi:predicted ATPase
LFPSSILIIEEPESNFHPKLQSKLAEFFIDASSKFNMKFIIETHSEYFIRKLQYWVARKIIRSNDIGIYYFPERTTSKEQNKIRKIHILNDGSLDDDFGPGFFDEATNWQWEMMRLKNSQNN